ncbi:Metal cation symporter ZIP14 [Halotydeus destructor]|nr:Metal cation symporter ZIP14 [Halotydeus destructor]
MGGLIVLPFVRRDARRTILTLFEGLAVGGLLGSAIIHLFPKAYNIDQERFQQYFSRIFVVFGGVYMFYIFERILKILTAYRNAKLKKPSPRRRTMSNRDEHFMMNMSTFNTRSVPSNPMISNIIADATAKKPNERSSSIQSAQSNSTKNQIDKCLASIRKATSQPSLNQRIVQPQSFGKGSLNHLSDAKTPSVISKQSYVADIAGRREDHDTAVNRLHTDSVTWMIVLGDASLNFIDGLSIGAAFDRNILAGISISIAIMLEEVPHRLGTFAVLIRAGLDMKQSFLRIFISACFLYPGLVMGVFLGDEADDASPYIFALAGGMFLYMALVDVMKEMNNSMEKALRNSFRSGFKILALQNLGIILAIFILSVLALYEQDMDFEQVELQELTGNALV